MASRLTPIGWIAKFLLVPVLAGAAGFFLIAPRIGMVPPPLLNPLKPAPAASDEKPVADSPVRSQVQSGPPPGVAVSVKPAAGAGPNLGHDSDTEASQPVADDSARPRVRRGHHPASMVAPPTDPQPDQDGSGG